MVQHIANVLLTHVNHSDGRLWQAILESQGVVVDYLPHWMRTAPILLDALKARYARGEVFPEMLIMDVGVRLPEPRKLLQAGDVCIWCQRHVPEMKIILLHSSATQISELEKRWALRRGATDLMPQLNRHNLLSVVLRLTSLLGRSLSPEPLHYIAELLTSQESEEVTVLQNTPPQEQVAELESAPVKALPEDTEFVIYRGVRVLKKKSAV
ncbi:MAG: hypothetical protein HC919_10915 [Oscillatoriales cyanobacterium SM2_2_1]|nr:hypothetical protein [Oscillatoriales cyanobacterium SM2_2_1]